LEEIVARSKDSVLRPYLVGLTPEAKKTLHGRDLPLAVIPFCVGRENRVHQDPEWAREKGNDRRKGKVNPNNNLYIRESEKTDFVSGEHFLIACEKRERFVLVDRRSKQGTLVNGKLVKGKEKNELVNLPDGSTIVLGGRNSPFKFRFEVRK
jgi:pSer/pThr/pTyr-binding forkhead associated (FHA) protein